MTTAYLTCAEQNVYDAAIALQLASAEADALEGAWTHPGDDAEGEYWDARAREREARKAFVHAIRACDAKLESILETLRSAPAGAIHTHVMERD